MRSRGEAGELVVAGEGFFTCTPDAGLLFRRGLLGKGSLHFANGLADFDASYGRIPDAEWLVFRKTLFNLITDHEMVFYTHLLAEYGPEAINPNLWRRLSSALAWPLGAQVFAAMPTEVLETVGPEIWQFYEDSPGVLLYKKETLTALSSRTDIYGGQSLPPELAFSLLVKEG